MLGVENIYSAKKIIAVIFRKNIKLSGVKFFTDASNPFQIGIHHRPKGVSLSPHVHKLTQSLTINAIQEILVVQKGKIKITFYTKKGKNISSKILRLGDSVLLMYEGHGVEFLEDSRIFEVKQGPYPGSKSAKTYFQNVKGK